MRKLILPFFIIISSYTFGQVGINTSNPLTIFHIDGNKDNLPTPTTAQLANDFTVSSTGATGIGTASVNSSAKLQIDATDKGVLIPRVILTSATDGTNVPSPAKGLIVYNTTSSANIEEGFYVNYGTPLLPQWRTFQKYDKTAWTLENIFDTVATTPINQVVSGATINNIDLGLSISVTIPPLTQSKLITNYSVPMGTTTISSGFDGYFGVRFLKNGTELPAGSRKYTVYTATGVASRMASVNATVGDTVVNSTNAPITVTFTLNGYVEPVAGSTTVRFNMWSTTDPNFNWGRSYMSVQVFNKPL